MAITIIQQPTEYTPIHSRMTYLINSTLTNEDSMRIVFTIDTGEVRTVKISPRPDGLIEFDISTHLRDFLNLDSFYPSTTITTIPAPFVSYTVTITEEYIDALGVLITGTPTVLSENIATNIVLNTSEIINFYDAYYRNANAIFAEESFIMLNSGSKSTYYKDDVIFIHSVGTGTGSDRFIRLREFDNNGGLLVTHSLEDLTGVDACQFYRLDLSTYVFNINTTQIGVTIFGIDALPTGNFPLTFESKYTLVNQVCLPYENFKIMYLDKLGSYNTINLGYKSNEELNIKRETFKQNSSPVNVVRTYFVEADETYTLNTGNLNSGDLLKFEDMMLSTSVFLDVRNLNDPKFNNIEYMPLIIKTNTLKRYKSENQELAQYTIKCEIANELNVRRR